MLLVGDISAERQQLHALGSLIVAQAEVGHGGYLSVGRQLTKHPSDVTIGCGVVEPKEEVGSLSLLVGKGDSAFAIGSEVFAIGIA